MLTHLQRAVECRLGHADDGERVLIEFDLLADDRRVGSEPLLPELIAEHDDRRGSCSVIIIRDGASQHRLYAQTGVIAAGDGLTVDDLCLLAYDGV